MNILIVQPDSPVVSETFLAAQAERLPGQVRVAHRDAVTRLDGAPVLDQHWLARGGRKVRRTLLRQSWNDQEQAALDRVIATCGADVVLAQYGPTGVRTLPGCRAAGIPLVVHFHGYDATRFSTLERFGDDYRLMFNHAAAIVAVSRAMRDQLIALGCPASKLHHIPYGADTSRFQGARPANAPPRFLAVGRLVEKKAPHLTLLAFARVLEQVPQATLKIIGEGPLRGVCQDLIEALGLSGSVTLLGAQSHDVVQREMAMARGFVQHSLQAADGDCEGTPVAIIEASASGLPVVATRHAGISDVVLHEQTGLLVDERDVTNMAQAMLVIARDGQYAAALGQAARERIKTHYRIEDNTARLANLLAQSAASAAPEKLAI